MGYVGQGNNCDGIIVYGKRTRTRRAKETKLQLKSLTIQIIKM